MTAAADNRIEIRALTMAYGTADNNNPVIIPFIALLLQQTVCRYFSLIPTVGSASGIPGHVYYSSS